PAGLGGKHCRALAARSIEVLVELDPYRAQCVGGVVGVSDADGSPNRFRGRIQGGDDRIIGTLLPILGTRGAGGRSVEVWSRPFHSINSAEGVIVHGGDRARDRGHGRGLTR